MDVAYRVYVWGARTMGLRPPSFARLAPVGIACLILARTAGADLVIVPEQKTDIQDLALDFRKIHVPLNDLKSVTVSVLFDQDPNNYQNSHDVHQFFSFQFTAPTIQTITVTGQAALSLTSSFNPSPILAYDSGPITRSLTGTDATYPNPVLIPNDLVPATLSSVYTSPADLAHFVGPGTITFTFHGSGSSSFTEIGGDGFGGVNTFEGAIVTLTYNVVPEPATLIPIVVGGGPLGLALVVRRWRSADGRSGTPAP
jgi:hypothetical protein